MAVMKTIIFSTLVMCIFIMPVHGQVSKKAAKQTVVSKPVAVKKQKTGQGQPSVTTLTSSSANAAFANVSDQRFKISDPTIRWFNNRANDIKADNGSSVIGMPKLSYGIAHGHLIFHPTAATSSGLSTGSGSVGTGSSIGNVGMSESGIGVNGRNPYAGNAIYGTRTQNELWLRKINVRN
jgi:hypothetical protein